MERALNIARTLALIALVSAASSAHVQAARLTLACGSAVKVDGNIAEKEWRDGSRIQLGDGAEFVAKISGKTLLAAVRLPPNSYRYIDLYISDSADRLLNLHASMKQGERVLTSGWSDTGPSFHWGPKAWQASIAKRTTAPPEAPIAEQLHPLQGYEMTIPLTYLGRLPLRIRLEVRDFEGRGKDWVYPLGSSRDSQRSWVQITQWPRCP